MRFKSLVVSTLLCSNLLVPMVSFADDTKPVVTLPAPPQPVPGEKDVGAAISPMKKGQVAPFTGVLLSPKATAVLITQINSIDEQVKIEVDRAVAEADAKCKFSLSEQAAKADADKKVLQAQVDERNKRIDILNEQLKKEIANRPNTTLWVAVGTGVGFVLGIALSAVTVYAVNQASK